MSILEKSKTYFKLFSKKDLKGMKKMLSYDVHLKDWEIEKKGIDSVLEANKRIFENVNSIKVTPVRIHIEKNVAIAQLIIDIDNDKEILHVVDVIKFNKSGMISSIRAFKG